MILALFLIVWFLAGYGHYDLLRDGERFPSMTDGGKRALLLLCLVLWPGVILVRLTRRRSSGG
jgi:hypothetical protein